MVFSQSFMAFNGSSEVIKYETVISDSEVAKTCTGHVKTTECYLVSAIGEYEVEVTDGIITFTEPPSYPRIVARANNTALTNETIVGLGLNSTMNADSINSTLSGITNSANIAFNAQVGLATYPARGGMAPGLSPAPNQYVFQHITNYAQMWGPHPDCAPAWRDPRDNVMAKLVRLPATCLWTE